MSAPALTSRFTTSLFPLLDAVIKAVDPFYKTVEEINNHYTDGLITTSCRFISAPAPISCCTISLFPSSDASIRAVAPTYKTEIGVSNDY